jgi:membrane-bound ClpP family serine protease
MTKEELIYLTSEPKEGERKEQQPTQSSTKKDAESKLLSNSQIVQYIFIAIGVILFLIGASENENTPAVIGVAIIVITLLNFAILIPLFKVLVNISRNLKELNKKNN